MGGCGILLVMTTLLTAENTEVDFADLGQKDCWLRHPVLGDPSFDAFEHAAGNPVCRGTPPYDWPVNGFLFEDPKSGHWYLYVGHYCRGYTLKPEAPSRCTVFCSPDRGRTWEHLGPIFEPAPFFFEDEVSPLSHAPDVSVIYAEGRYHLCFDWTTENTTWQNAANPPADANSGVGYAWSERPEGPFHIAGRPVATTRAQSPLLGKYRRLYASTIIRRKEDWLVLTLTDSGSYFGWALLGMTAANPDGPYTEPRLLLHPESGRFYPPLLEFFPAFTHAGYIYAPATSVALNRNFQALFRVPIEDAMHLDAWEIAQQGSVWHAEPLEHEAAGIWGQTFSGFVDRDGLFHVMFPARDEKGFGTINIASRPWDTPFRAQGFVVSGHDGPSLARLTRNGTAQRIEVTLARRGKATLFWNCHAPLGPDRPASNATLHPLALTRYTGIELDDGAWVLVVVDDAGTRSIVAEGAIEERERVEIQVVWTAPEVAALALNEREVWAGMLPAGPGGFGLLAAAHSHVRVDRFQIAGDLGPATIVYLYTEALVGAAQSMQDWEERKDPAFRHGIGVVTKGPQAAAKWNFEGSAFTLCAPTGPEYGAADLLLDGTRIASLDFGGPDARDSHPVHSSRGLAAQPHALTIMPIRGRVPLDVLEVTAP